MTNQDFKNLLAQMDSGISNCVFDGLDLEFSGSMSEWASKAKEIEKRLQLWLEYLDRRTVAADDYYHQEENF